MRFPAVLAALLIVAAVACDGGEPAVPPTPPTVLVWAEPSFADGALTDVSELLAARGLASGMSATAARADLAVLGQQPAEGGVPFVARYWVAAVAPPRARSTLDMASLAGALAGRSSTRVFVPLEPAPPIASWFDEPTTVTEALPIDEIPAALADGEDAIALLPLDAVDVHVRSVPVDGIDIVFGDGDVAQYPLVERGWVVRGDVDDEELATTFDSVADELAGRLGVDAPEPILLRFTGDIIPARCVYAKQRDYGDFRHAFLELGPWLSEADITVGSLDAAISDAGVPFGCVETFSLMAPAASVEGLAYSGFDVITVATNHVKDCGQNACGDQAFFDTLDNLRANEIAPVGGGAGLAEARQPAYLRVRGVRFAFLGYDEIAPYYHAEPGVPGTAPLTEAYLREDVALAAADADVVVVLPQWGVEYTADPTFQQRTLAAAAVDAGADLVIGNHPHWVEANEIIDGTFVAYALGNFVFDQDWSIETQQGAVLDAAFAGDRLLGVRYHPIRIVDEHQPTFAGPEDAQQIWDRIWDASARLGPP